MCKYQVFESYPYFPSKSVKLAVYADYPYPNDHPMGETLLKTNSCGNLSSPSQVHFFSKIRSCSSVNGENIEKKLEMSLLLLTNMIKNVDLHLQSDLLVDIDALIRKYMEQSKYALNRQFYVER
jgi:hypothetical protein